MAVLAMGLGSCQKPGPQVQNSRVPATASASAEISAGDPEVAPPQSSPVSAGGTPSSDTSVVAPVEPFTDPIDPILSADLAPGETSSRLLALFRTTPAEEKSFLIQLAGNYCPDEEYWRLLPFLLDRTLPEDCQEELLADVLCRPDAVRLRPLYRLAMDPTHRLCAEAREYLFAYLPDVPENDLNALGRAVERAERENRP